MPMQWGRGRGKLGLFQALLGTWVAEADSPQGPVCCVRRFERALGAKYVRLEAHWEIAGTTYDELALFGVDRTGVVRFWSFTSDGKQSSGTLVEAPDLHERAIAFEAQMDAGLARQVYWPDEEEGFRWVVESHSKKGWNRFVEHHYLPEPHDG